MNSDTEYCYLALDATALVITISMFLGESPTVNYTAVYMVLVYVCVILQYKQMIETARVAVVFLQLEGTLTPSD